MKPEEKKKGAKAGQIKCEMEKEWMDLSTTEGSSKAQENSKNFLSNRGGISIICVCWKGETFEIV